MGTGPTYFLHFVSRTQLGDPVFSTPGYKARERNGEREEEWETHSDGEHARRNFFSAEHQTIQSRATWIATCTLSQLAARIPALTHAL